MLIGFDLDDTLMWCGQDYVTARDTFVEYMSQQFDVEPDRSIEVSKRMSDELKDEYGLDMERFPTSLVRALETLADSPTDRDRLKVRDIGYSAFKSKSEYAARGLEDGAEEILTELSTWDVALHLITAGDERIQNRKIEGLDLYEHFDGCHIVPMNTKDEKMLDLMDEYEIEPTDMAFVGNSFDSDIGPARRVGATAIHIDTYQWRTSDEVERLRNDPNVHHFDTLKQFQNNLDILRQINSNGDKASQMEVSRS